MAQGHKSCNLQEEIKQIFLKIGPLKSSNKIAEVSQKSHVVQGVAGVVRFTASPHYSLTLDTGTAEFPFTLPLTLVDSVKHLSKWIAVIGKKVWIYQLLVVCEQFQIIKKNKKLQYVNIFAKWEDINIFEESLTKDQITSPLHQNQNSEPYENNSITKLEAEDVLSSSSTCRVMVHHVSMPFFAGQQSVFCLVFISYTDRRQLEVKLWLVLRGTQVAWREFLVPNREYLIKFPSQLNKYYFDESHKPLDKIFTQPSRELEVIFHHKLLFYTMNGSELPVGSKMFLTCNTQFSVFIYRFVKDPFCSWYSANEAAHAGVDLVTFYGQVDTILYIEEQVFKSCYLCIREKPKEPSLQEPQVTTSNSWTNPWESQLSIGKDELFELPAAEDENRTMRTGVPGSLVQRIKLRDVITGTEQSVYIKHSYVSNSQQLFRLASGTVLCITHLNRRCSGAGKYYFITTVLSSFRVLSYPNNETSSEGWGLYGLRHFTPDSQEKLWGVLELFNLSKIAITAKCKHCKATFSRGICSNECSSPKTCITSAHAIGWVQIIHDKKTISLEKILIKDNFVQKLLCIPDDVWQMFLKLATEREIVCFLSEQNMNEIYPQLDVNELFKMYCNTPKPRGKYYICVKKMSTFTDEEPFYYCIHLEPVENRLNIVAELTTHQSWTPRVT